MLRGWPPRSAPCGHAPIRSKHRRKGNTKHQRRSPESEWGSQLCPCVPQPSSTLGSSTHATPSTRISGADCGDLLLRSIAPVAGRDGRQHGDARPPRPRHHPPAARRLPQARPQGHIYVNITRSSVHPPSRVGRTTTEHAYIYASRSLCARRRGRDSRRRWY